jgi:hypothetical protein
MDNLEISWLLRARHNTQPVIEILPNAAQIKIPKESSGLA